MVKDKVGEVIGGAVGGGLGRSAVEWGEVLLPSPSGSGYEAPYVAPGPWLLPPGAAEWRNGRLIYH